MAEAIIIGAVVTLVLEKVISYARTAQVCSRACRDLEKELVRMRPDVRKIEQQLIARRQMVAAEPLEVVEGWLARLKQDLDEAAIVVHKCNSGSRVNVRENYKLTKQILSHLKKIHETAGSGADRATLSSSLSNGSSHAGVSGNNPGMATQTSMDFHQWNDERNHIELAADETERENASHEQSHYHYGYFQHHHAPQSYSPQGWPSGHYTHHG